MITTLNDEQIYELYVTHIWSKIPDYYRDEIDQCEDVILAGIKTIIATAHSTAFPSGLVSTEGSSWAMENQCDCTYNGALGHHPHCPASPEYKAKMPSLPCRTCGQLLSSAPTGEYPCPACGLPRLHDEVPR